MNMNTIFIKSQLKFYILLIALSIPFWLVATIAQSLSKWIPMNLPVSALMVVCPTIAAMILIYREEKIEGIRKLLHRVFDPRGVKRKVWYIPIILLMPLIMLLSYWLMRLMNFPLPEPQISVLTTLILFVVFFITAVLEEIGWMGYLVDPMLNRWTALKASIILGTTWSIWHIIPNIQSHHDFAWIVWQSLFSIAARILIVWLYNNNGKSILATILFHTMINVSDALFPVNASHYNPAITGAITIVLVVIVTFLWGPKTLACFRYGKHRI